MAVKLELPERAVTQAGAPAAVWLEYISPPSGNALFVDVTWVNKTATRLPEVRPSVPSVPNVCLWLCRPLLRSTRRPTSLPEVRTLWGEVQIALIKRLSMII